MKKLLSKMSYAALMLVVLSGFVMGQINITFQFNASTIPDTLHDDGVVKILGNINGTDNVALPSGEIIGWDFGNADAISYTNVGGDYWAVTVQMNADDTLNYKIRPQHAAGHFVFPNDGWESDDAPMREFISGSNDTIVDVEFFRPQGSTEDQFFRPYIEYEDSVAFYFRVNMGQKIKLGEFNPDTDLVGVRAGEILGGPADWSTSIAYLERELNSNPEDGFYSGALYMSVDSVTHYMGETPNFKFVYESGETTTWESSADRPLPLNSTADTTLQWDWFSMEPYTSEDPVEGTLYFRVSTQALQSLGLFDRTLFDSITVRGDFNSWGQTPLTYQPDLREWIGSADMNLIVGTGVNYKYFIDFDSSRIDPESPNYVPGLRMGDVNDGWEEPASTGGSNRVHNWLGGIQSIEGDFGFDKQFFNGVPANGIFDEPVNVHFSVNMAPAADAGYNDEEAFLFEAGNDVYIVWDQELLAVAGLGQTSTSRMVQLTDGDADMVYTGTITLPQGWYQVGYRIRYFDAAATDSVSPGGSTLAGRRYYQYIVPDSVGQAYIDETNQFHVTQWPDDYYMPTVNWSKFPLPIETPPDLTQPGVPVGIYDNDGNMIAKFDLRNNYPNPFNPSTIIPFEVAKQAHVEIIVYNIMGQKVNTLFNKSVAPGNHVIEWRGLDNNGRQVASGVYFVRMKANGFSKVQKMVLMR